jgi:putative transposase
MNVSRSAYYAWRKRPAKIITSAELNLYRRLKVLFKASRNSLGSRELSRKLREEGFCIGRYRTRTLMRRMDLYSRRIVGWHIDKRLTKDLVAKALMKAINLRQPNPSRAWFFIVIAAHNILAVFIESYRQPMVSELRWAT